MELTDTYKDLVKAFGGQVKTGEALGVEQPSVSAWVTGKARMAEITAMKAEILTKGQFKAIDLCPKLAELESVKAQKTSLA